MNMTAINLNLKKYLRWVHTLKENVTIIEFSAHLGTNVLYVFGLFFTFKMMLHFGCISTIAIASIITIQFVIACW